MAKYIKGAHGIFQQSERCVSMHGLYITCSRSLTVHTHTHFFFSVFGELWLLQWPRSTLRRRPLLTRPSNATPEL